GGLLPGDANRVDRIDQRDRIVDRGLAGQLEAIVEVAVDLQDPRAVQDGLRELAHRDLALGHQDGAGEPGARGIRGRGGRSVAGGRADDRLEPAGQRVRDGHGHPAVLERAGRVGALDLEVDLAAGQLGQVRRGQQRRVALAERDHLRPVRHRDPLPVRLDDPRPGALDHWSSPSTRITLTTSCTTSSFPISSTVDCSAASGARWVTTTRLARSPVSLWRTAAMLTSCAANACATWASTPARSATERLTW